jgi:hypothetical protein
VGEVLRRCSAHRLGMTGGALGCEEKVKTRTVRNDGCGTQCVGLRMTGGAALLNWRTASEGGPYKTQEGGLKPPLQRRRGTQEHSQEWLCHKEGAGE